MTIADVDQVELNEAFAAQVIRSWTTSAIPLEKLNPPAGRSPSGTRSA